MSELKPCPFCGGDAKRVAAHPWSWVTCGSCSAESGIHKGGQAAIAAWNRRSEPAPGAGVNVKALRRAMDHVSLSQHGMSDPSDEQRLIQRGGSEMRGAVEKLCREVGQASAGQWVSVAQARFWMRVSERGSCWVWKGATNKDGYGYLRDGEKTVLAHRHAWSSLFGEILGENQILHKCDNPPCCNPAHLFVGTHEDNMRDMAEKGRAAKGVTSRYRGVSKVGDRWRATCGRDNKHVGYFDTELEAAMRYDVAASERIGESAKLNFPDIWDWAKGAAKKFRERGSNSAIRLENEDDVRRYIESLAAPPLD